MKISDHAASLLMKFRVTTVPTLVLSENSLVTRELWDLLT